MFSNSMFSVLPTLFLMIALTFPVKAEVLIYSDQTPGSVIYAEVSCWLAEQRGEDVWFVTDVETFEQELMYPVYPDWSSVVVAAQYSSDTPVYAEALVDYAVCGGRVELYIWHDNDSPQPDEHVVLASTGVVIWSHGHTVTSYVPRWLYDAVTVEGYHFPDFQGVELIDPMILYPQGPLADDISDCVQDCLSDYDDARRACDEDHDDFVELCNNGYEIGSAGWEQCMQDADTAQHACNLIATRELFHCLAGCRRADAKSEEGTGGNAAEPEPV